LLRKYTDLQILRAIKKEDISQPSIAKEVGFSLGKVNFVLKVLVEKGFVKTEKFISSNNIMRYKYLLTEGILMTGYIESHILEELDNAGCDFTLYNNY
jgi:DNA-binding Lrp family transcriptional regulator